MIVWLASYPKSGNTWLRAILSTLIHSTDGKFKPQFLNKIFAFPAYTHFKNFTDNINDINEVKKYWIKVQEKLNLDNDTKFIKTHHVNCEIDGYRFTNKKNTQAVIYLVRDPRNVVTSLSNYFGLKTEEAVKRISNPLAYKGETDVATIVGSWSQNYNSWKNSDNLYLIKYEDLIKNTQAEINKLFLFLKTKCNLKINSNINEIIESTSFENLQNMEKKKLLDLPVNNGKNFFYLGKKNKWENILDQESAKDIKKIFKTEMTELGYL